MAVPVNYILHSSQKFTAFKPIEELEHVGDHLIILLRCYLVERISRRYALDRKDNKTITLVGVNVYLKYDDDSLLA